MYASSDWLLDGGGVSLGVVESRELGTALIGGLAAVSAGDAVIERVVVCGLFGVFAADGGFRGVGEAMGE